MKSISFQDDEELSETIMTLEVVLRAIIPVWRIYDVHKLQLGMLLDALKCAYDTCIFCRKNIDKDTNVTTGTKNQHSCYECWYDKGRRS